jgi:D-glycero-alpha-D-manno-heptose-7-phosphate kinase
MANQEGQLSLYVRAPLRVDFAGSWSDDPAFVDSEGGCVVNAAIESYVHIEFLTGGKTIRLFSDDPREHLTISSPAQLMYNGKLDRHKAALNMLPVTGGIEIHSRTDVPPGSGLGEDAALDIALLAGLARGRLEDYDVDEFVELGVLLDTGELGLSGLRQDHYAAVFGGFSELRCSPECVERRTIPVSRAAAEDLAEHVLLLYTGQTHFSVQTYQRIWSAYASDDRKVSDAIGGMRDVAIDVRTVLEARDWEALAALVNRNWQYQLQLDATMSTPHIRSIETAVRDAGAWGLKAVGEGAGGCFLVVCPPDRRDSVAAAAEAGGASQLCASFSFEGVTVVEPEDDRVVV